jgi:hypothetical protein
MPMNLASTAPRRLAGVGALAAAVLAASFAGGAATVSAAPASGTWSTSAVGCLPGDLSLGSPSGARVADGATAQEPKLYPDNEAKAYGALPDAPYLGNGTITVPTIFHVVSDHELSPTEQTRMEGMISAQMTVLNDSYSGKTSADAADTPFRFALDKTTWTVNPSWYTVVPGKNERDMKKALYEGDSTTLNVYVANIGGGLLGWSYFPKDYNNGRDYIDGVVMLDESMPGGVNPDDPTKPWKYGEGDTLTHEVGHWLMLEHTFARGCAASGDWVADTPKEAQPQFNCPVGADTCLAPGLDPIHNFMDYTQDSCMDEFTVGQAERMSDAWVAFRAGGNGGQGKK